MTTFDKMPKDEKEKLKKYLDKNFPESEIELKNIKIDYDSKYASFSNGRVEVKVPAPDKPTTNTIWQVLAGGAIAIAGVIAGAKLYKDNKK